MIEQASPKQTTHTPLIVHYVRPTYFLQECNNPFFKQIPKTSCDHQNKLLRANEFINYKPTWHDSDIITEPSIPQIYCITPLLKRDSSRAIAQAKMRKNTEDHQFSNKNSDNECSKRFITELTIINSLSPIDLNDIAKKRRKLSTTYKPNLILDIDETLIHSVSAETVHCKTYNFLPLTKLSFYSANSPLEPVTMKFAKRPFLDLFLNNMAEKYNLVVIY